MRAKTLQSCLTLWDPLNSSLPGSSIQGILQARILEWVTISFSQGNNIPHYINTMGQTVSNYSMLFSFFGISWGYINNFEKHLKLIIVTYQSWPHYTPICHPQSTINQAFSRVDFMVITKMNLFANSYRPGPLKK